MVNIEVRNDTKKTIWVRLCRSMLGRLYLHVQDVADEHVRTSIEPHDYEAINEASEDDVEN